jgi:hypothetical protein
MTREEPRFDGYITLKEASQISGYSADYIGQLIRKGKIKGKQVYTNIAWVTTEDELRAYMDGTSESDRKDVMENTLEPSTLSNEQESPEGMRWVGFILYILLSLAVIAALFVLYAIVTSSDSAIRTEALRNNREASPPFSGEIGHIYAKR